MNKTEWEIANGRRQAGVSAPAVVSTILAAALLGLVFAPWLHLGPVGISPLDAGKVWDALNTPPPPARLQQPNRRVLPDPEPGKVWVDSTGHRIDHTRLVKDPPAPLPPVPAAMWLLAAWPIVYGIGAVTAAIGAVALLAGIRNSGPLAGGAVCLIGLLLGLIGWEALTGLPGLSAGAAGGLTRWAWLSGLVAILAAVGGWAAMSNRQSAIGNWQSHGRQTRQGR